MADMDEFAQTRGDDDLFDDEIIPVSAEEQQAQTEVIPEPELVPEPEHPVLEKQPSPHEDISQPGRADRARGRGRGRGKGGRGLQDSKFADPKRAESPRAKGTAKTPEPETKQETEVAPADQHPEEAKDLPGQEEEAKGEVSVANGAEPQRVPAVKGDRSATGGVRKPKLTEEELTKRIAAAKENAAKKAAAHARAEADQASFLEREQVAAEKRRQDQANRRVMDNEREQNRQRKLKAQTGREWDSEKREEDYNPRGGGSQFRRGMHGGVSGYVRRDFEGGDEASTERGDAGPRGRGVGRGGRGRGRRSSRGPRGERASSPAKAAGKTAIPEVNNEAQFPSLPEGKKPEASPTTGPAVKTTKTKTPSMEELEASLSPMSGTWADQGEN